MSIDFGFSRLSPTAWQVRVLAATCALFALALAAHAQQLQPETPQPPAPGTATPAPAADAPQAPAQNTAQPAPVQTPASVPDATQPPAMNSSVPGNAQASAAAPADVHPVAPASLPAGQSTPPLQHAQASAISEAELKQMLVGKQFYLRNGYLGDTLNFDERGRIVSHSPRGSYTLSIVQIDHVRLTKHKVELEGTRYGLHFNEQLAYEDSSKAYDQVRITPNKKVVRITFDREMVVSPKKKKETAKEKGRAVTPAVAAAPAPGAAPAAAPVPTTATAAASTETPSAPASVDVAVAAQTSAPAPAAPSQTPDQAAQASSTPSSIAPAAATSATEAASEPGEMSDADQLKASIAAAPEAERPADPSSVTTTTSQAHANQLLRDALDATFAPGLDERMMTAMPDFWKLYYQSVAEKRDYHPADPSVLRQNAVDEKAHLLTSFEPDSNDFAQSAGVAGMALYHTVIGPDGKPGEIAVARPIGFGLDENAVAAIRKAKFSPAIKDGKPVPVMLDLVVQFRIFSNRTAAQSAPETADTGKSTDSLLPGPYSLPHPN
jgi:TonB family protein